LKSIQFFFHLFQADLTSLMFASFHNHPSVALALIDAGCDLNAVGTVSKDTSLTDDKTLKTLTICTSTHI